MIIILRVLSVVVFALSANVASAQQIGTIGVGDITVSASAAELRTEQDLRTDLDRSISAALVRTRKYTVVDHPQLVQRLASQGLTLDEYYADQDRESGLYKQAGLDYILKVDVKDVRLTPKKSDGADALVAQVDLDYKMFGVADLTDDFSAKVSAQASANIDRSNGRAVQGLIDQAIVVTVKRLTNHLTTTLFPIRVVKIDPNYTITLNYGAGLLTTGDTVLVYGNEADISFAASGEAQSKALATLKVVDTKKKFATAHVVNGASALKKGLPAQLVSGTEWSE